MGTFETFLNKLDRHLALLQLIGYRLQPDELAKIEGVEQGRSFDPEALILKKDGVELWLDLGLPDPGAHEEGKRGLWQLRDASVRIVIQQAEDDVFSLEVEREASDGTFHLKCSYDDAGDLEPTPLMREVAQAFDIAIGASRELDEHNSLEAIGCVQIVVRRIFSGKPLPTDTET